MVNQLDKIQWILLRMVAFRFNMTGQDIKNVSWKLNLKTLNSRQFYGDRFP